MRLGGLGSRATALERLAATTGSQPLDLLVVGGGITGAGIALDAASRGMNVGLVERADFASGTSSKSSKLVHGGLRYLEQKEFALVREASSERGLLARLAPHLVEPIPFVIPVSDRWQRAQFGAGLWAYDALSRFRNVALHRYLDPDETELLIPPLKAATTRGAYSYYDSKTDDVRLVMEVLVQARRQGAVVTNYASVRDLDGADELCGAEVEDRVGGETFEVRARRIIVAAGVWSDQVEALAHADATPRLRPSKGIHLVFDRDVLPMADAAAFIPDPSNERMLFVIPWLDAVIVGTTDTPYGANLDEPRVEQADRDYCLDAVNAAFDLSLTEDDIAGAYAGLRPLIAASDGATADLSRRHAVYDIAPGITGITGGKLTTYRRMAIDAVDRVAAELGVKAESKTHRIRLGSANLDALRLAMDGFVTRLGLSAPVAENLLRSYGDRALAVLELAADQDLGGPLCEGRLPLAAEATYCARAEMALALGDLLARRTRLALTDRGAGVEDGSRAVEIMGRELRWSRRERKRQLETYRSEIERERGFPVGSSALPEQVRAG